MKKIKLISKAIQNKLSSLYLAFGLMIFKTMAFAIATGDMPSDITTNTDKVESGLAWALKIGGAGAVIWGCVSYARNKLQGEAVDTIVKIVIGLGAASFGLGWWIGKAASASSGFAF